MGKRSGSGSNSPTLHSIQACAHISEQEVEIPGKRVAFYCNKALHKETESKWAAMDMPYYISQQQFNVAFPEKCIDLHSFVKCHPSTPNPLA